MGAGFAILLRRCPTDERAALAQTVAQTLRQTAPQEKDVGAWIQGACAAMAAFDTPPMRELLKKEFRVSGPPAVYIQVMTSATQMDVARPLLEYFIPEQEGAAIVGELKKTCAEGRASQGFADTVQSILTFGGRWAWSDLVTAINQRTDGTPAVQTAEWTELLRTLLELSRTEATAKVARPLLEQMAQRGKVLHHLNQAQIAKAPDAFARSMEAMLYVNPTGNVLQHWQSSPAGHTLYNNALQKPENYPDAVAAYAEICLKHSDPQKLIQLCQNAPNTKKWTSATLDRIASENPHFFDSSTVLEEYPQIAAALSPGTLENLVGHLTRDANLLPVLEEQPFHAGKEDLYILALAACPEKELPALGRFLARGLGGATSEDWEQSISHEGPLVELAITLPEKGQPPQLGQEFSDALLKQAKATLAGQAPPSRLAQRWPHLTLALETSQRTTFWRNIRDELFGASGKQIPSLLPLYGEGLSQSGVLTEKADEVVRRILGPIIDRQDTTELRWLRTTLSKDPDILKQAKKESIKDLRARVNTALDSQAPNDKTAQQELEEIARTLGISLPEIGAPPNEPEGPTATDA